jgi:alpha-L-arabinofuranosidase
MCHAQGIKPYITVNIGSGDPKEAGEWARYCAAWFTSRALELPEIYFQMGNEHYGVWESAHMTAPMYLEALKEFVPAVRENYPKSVIIGLGEPLCSGAAGEPDTELRKLVLLEARELLDVIAINRYKGQWYDNPRDQMLNVAESVLKIEKNLLEVIEDCRSAGFPPRVALPEWNYWLHASHWDGKQFFEPDDVQHGLFVSGMFHMMARLAPEMEVAAYETAVNCMGLIRNEGTHVVETSVSGLFRLYRPAFPGRVVSLKISTPDLENGCPQLDVLALRQDKKLWVFASNRSLLKAITVDLNGTPKAPVEARLFAAHDYQAPLLEVSPLMKDEAWVLPPLSLMRLCYHVES